LEITEKVEKKEGHPAWTTFKIRIEYFEKVITMGMIEKAKHLSK